MKKLPTVPSSKWQCIKLCLGVMPELVKANWPLYLAIVVLNGLASAIPQPNMIFAGMVSLVTLVIGWYLFASFLYKSNASLSGQPTTYKETFSIIAKRFPRLVGAYILFGILIVALISIPFALHYLDSKAEVIAGIASIVVSLIMLWILLSLGYFLPSIVLDNSKIFESYKHSFNLVKGHWWRNFLIIFATYLISMIIIGLIIAIITTILYFAGAVKASPFVAYVLLTLYVPLPMTAILLVQYNDLKLRHQL